MLKGNLKGDYIFDAVCDTFIDKPDVCNPYANLQSDILDEPTTYSELFLWIICFLGVFLTIFFICQRRKIKRDLNKEMNLQINTALSHYFKMQDESSTEQSAPPKKFVEAQYI